MKYMVCLLIIVLNSISIHSETGANKIVVKADRYRGFRNWFSSTSRITYFKNNSIHSKQLLKIYIKDNSNSLVKFLSPASMKGRVLLMTGNNVWIHIPKTRNPIRLTPQQRLLGQVSNGDIARMNYQEDYNATLLGYKTVSRKNCFHLLLQAKRKNTTYRKIEYFVERNTFKPVKVIFYAISGKKLKEGYFKKPKHFYGRVILTRMDIFDHIRQNEHTTIESLVIKKEHVPGQYFNKNFLKRVR